jgi:hypothetical protein
MATKTADAEPKEAFDVSKTDKRNDKRVVLDYVFVSRYAPDLLSYFEKYAQDLDEQLATEGITEIVTPVDTTINGLREALVARYEGEYADYDLRGNGASFFVPKAERVKVQKKSLVDQVKEGSPEEQAALAALLKELGLV